MKELDLLIMLATGQSNGNAFVWRAAILIALMLAQSGKQLEAVSKLEDVKAKQKAYLGPKATSHPTLEYTVGQIANAAAKINDFKKALDAYNEVLKIKEDIYGPYHEILLVPMLT